ncbi:MAG: hypothetical protein ORN49_10770, partial [Rhodobacteraceae bacterium]|nr:hypothetical protein [Paracoccaceae bacterium]
MNIGRSFGGTNLEHARVHNRRAVFDVIRRAGSISRAMIAKETGLTVQTISNIVEDLAGVALLTIGDPVRGGRGQPYSINPSGGWTVGVHVSRHGTSVVLMDLAGRVVAADEISLDPKTPHETIP